MAWELKEGLEHVVRRGSQLITLTGGAVVKRINPRFKDKFTQTTQRPSDGDVSDQLLTASKQAKELAEEYHVDLGQVTPTGANNTIKIEDVRKYLVDNDIVEDEED